MRPLPYFHTVFTSKYRINMPSDYYRPTAVAEWTCNKSRLCQQRHWEGKTKIRQPDRCLQNYGFCVLSKDRTAKHKQRVMAPMKLTVIQCPLNSPSRTMVCHGLNKTIHVKKKQHNLANHSLNLEQCFLLSGWDQRGMQFQFQQALEMHPRHSKYSTERVTLNTDYW